MRSLDRAYQAVRADILSGAHLAGSRLREERLAAAIGVSRTPVREALRRLHSEGLVEILPNKGAIVAHWDDQELDEIFELRALLEGYSARRAATRIGGEQLAELSSLAAAMDQRLRHWTEHTAGQVSELNLRFHHAVHVAARSRHLLPLLSGIIQVPLVRHTFHRYTRQELVRSFAHHHEIHDALAAHDPDWAESVMRSHVRNARASLRRQAIQHQTEQADNGEEMP